MSLGDSARWFVWDRESGPPRFEHESEDSAIREARRLASLNAGRRFLVLKTIAEAERIEPVRIKRFEAGDLDDGIPF